MGYDWNKIKKNLKTNTEEEEEKEKTTGYDWDKIKSKARLENTINFDTIDSDLKALGTTVESVYTGWQPKDTINTTKSSITAMQERLNAYQEYSKMFGGEDVSDLVSGYQTVLADLDNLSAKYGKFKTADDYKKADERAKSLTTADLKSVSAEVEDLDKQIAEIKSQKEKFDSSYKAAGGYVPSASNYNRPSASQVDSYKEWQAKSSEYDKQLKELENKKADKKAYYEDAKSTQETLAIVQKETKMASDPKNMEAYNQYVANWNEARTQEQEEPWWVTALGSIGGSGNDFTDMTNTVVKAKESDKSWQLPQGDWSDDEKRVLGGYFLEDTEKALDYIVKKNNEKAKAEQSKTEQKITESATSSFGAGVAHTVGSIIAAPLGLADIMDDATDRLAGRPIIEESTVTPFEYSQAVKSGITTHLNDMSGTLNEKIPVLGGKGLGDVYGLGVSVLESGAHALALGPVGTAISYFGQGAASGVDDALSRGATDEQALLYGLVLGTAEAASEYIGADKLLKLGSANEVRKILVDSFKKGGGKAFWEVVDKQGKAELLEELASSVVGKVADSWILQDKSNLETKAREYRELGMSAKNARAKAWMDSIEDVAYDVISGYLSGAVHAAPTLAVSTAVQNAENKKVGAEIRGNERVSDVLNIASLTPQESDAYEAYTRYAEQGINADNITDAQVGNLYGMTDANARDVLSSKKSTLEQRQQATETIKKLSDVYEKGTISKDTIENIDRRNTYEEGLHESANLLIQEGLESAQDTDSFKLAKQFKERVDNGETLSTKDMLKLQQANDKAIKQEEVTARVENLPKEEANLFLKTYDGQSNVDEFGDSFNLVVELSKNNYDQDYILEHRGVLTTGQVNAIYKEVVTNPKLAQQKRIDALVKKQNGNLEIKGKIDDSVIDYDNTGAEGKVNWNDIHPDAQKTIVTTTSFVSTQYGADVVLVKDGRDYGFTGKFDRIENTVYIDVTALTESVTGADTKGRKDNSRFIASTIAHELTHWGEEKSPVLYADYSRTIMGVLTSGGKTEAQVLGERRVNMEKAEARRAAKENRTPREITDYEVRREVVARASEDLLVGNMQGEQIFESLPENERKQLVDKIKEIVQDIKDWIKNVLSKLRSDAPEAKQLRELATDIDSIAKKWDTMLRDAGKVDAAMKKEGINDKAITESKFGIDTEHASIDEKYWRTGFSKTEFAELVRIAKHESGKSTGYIDNDNKWLYNNKNGRTYFAIYSTTHIDNPTILYASKGKMAENENQWFKIFIAKKELFENGGNDLQRRTINRVLVSLGYALGESGVYSGVDAKRRGNNRNVGVHSGASGVRPSAALLTVLENIAETQERESGVTQYSDIDSDGNTLSKEQQEFFKDSKVRDESGKLKVMYHGTPNAGFTKFKSGTYFTEHKWYAERYKERSASSLSYKKTADNPDVYAVYLNIKKPFDTRSPEEARIFNKEYLGHYGMGTPLMESGLPDWLDGMDLQEFLEEQGYDYDGLILDEGSVGGYGEEVVNRGLSYVVFSPEQVKNVDNTTPTSGPDIRYSDIDDLDDLNAQLKEKQNQIYSATMEVRKFDAKAAEEKLYAVLDKKGASQEEIDNALQEYSNWGKESGYADAFAKHSALKDEEKQLRREIQKVEDRLHEELKEQIAHWDEEDVKKYVAKAVSKYRTTTRLDKASYLVTTGSMLDFSDGQGYRVKDPREISEILDLPSYAEYSDGMIAFMNMGNIRLQTYGIDLSAMPNAKQFSALRDVIFTVMRENDEFSVDFSKTDGYSAGSVTYGKGTSASKIIADIKSYFETGVVPEEQSNIRDFLYSDIDAEVDIYEVLGENKRLTKENKILRADFERLMERRKLEGKLTHGKQLNKNQLDIVAGHIRNLGNSTYSKEKLVEKLNEVYTHIATSDELAWDDLFARFYGIAEDVLDEARPVRSPNEYYANIYKELRNMEISLSNEQKQYVKTMLGVDASKAFFGKMKVTDKGMPLNSKWEELAGKYPNEFAETNDLNQVLELLEIYETAKELKEVVEEYDKVEQTRWLANEIYNQYWNVSPIRTVADKYEKKIQHLKYEHRTAMKELRDSYNERIEKQKKADREERSRIFKKLREDHIKELKEIKRAGKERLDKYKDEAARKTRIQSITAGCLSLNDMLIKNSKDKHITDAMKGPVINLLQAIDFSSKRALGMWGGDMKGVPTSKDISLQKALSQVKEMMADASVGKEDLVELYGHDLDPDIKEMVDSVDNIMRTVGDNEFILNKMTLEDLNTLDKVVKTIKHAVSKMNEFHTVQHAKGINNLAQEEIAYADKLGKEKIYKSKSLKAGAKKLLAWKNINPYYAFKRFGTAGKKIFEAFQDGYDKFAFNIKEIIDFTKSAYTRKEVREWEEEIKTFKVRMPATEQEMSTPDYEPQYQEVKLTVAQVMDLYLLNKREAAKAHLLGGGIRIADIEAKKGEVISQAEGVLLEQKEIDEIVGSLTARQIEVADKLSWFMNTISSAWGNEVSMARFGYRAFDEKNYVPMQVDKNNLAVDDETEKNNSLFRLLNMSFTKSLTEGANNRLVVSSIFDVFAQHTSDMAKYNALALPVLDAFRWYNYKEKGFKGDVAFETKSVKQAIENAFGKDGQNYITTFLKDLNGQENTTRDTVGKGFFTKAKIASVGANLRVALLQPTAYLRASANIAPKYLLKGIGLHKPKTSIELAEKYCGMALWKSLGYYDTNVQRGVADQIKHAESGYDNVVEASMKGAELGDKLTFGALWNAAELEVKDKRQDLKDGSEEFYVEVGKRLREIIYTTQVVDSVMTRSEMMRSGDGWDKFLTTFASEPTLSYNMLADAYLQTQLDARELGSKKEAIKKNSKHVARVFVAYSSTNLAAALVESVFDIIRDDDDEEEDEFIPLYLENFLSNQSITSKIPWLKEGVSILQGLTSSRLDTQGFQAFANTIKQIVKLAQGEGSWGKTIKSGVQSASYLSGLPFYNAYRDFMATIVDWLSPEELDEILKDFY